MVDHKNDLKQKKKNQKKKKKGTKNANVTKAIRTENFGNGQLIKKYDK